MHPSHLVLCIRRIVELESHGDVCRIDGVLHAQNLDVDGRVVEHLADRADLAHHVVHIALTLAPIVQRESVLGLLLAEKRRWLELGVAEA